MSLLNYQETLTLKGATLLKRTLVTRRKHVGEGLTWAQNWLTETQETQLATYGLPCWSRCTNHGFTVRHSVCRAFTQLVQELPGWDKLENSHWHGMMLHNVLSYRWEYM